jgi:hypothetical protein
MKVSKGTLTCLAAEGRATLQIPQLVIEIHTGKPVAREDLGENEPDAIECEADWFMYLKSSGVPVIGRQQGFLYFSRKGYEACKEMLREAFSNKRGSSWADFELAAEEHFQNVERHRQRVMRNLKRDLDALKKLSV